MEHKLSDMTLEELWMLFPVQLSAPNDCWRGWYTQEEQTIREILSPDLLEVHHISSTAVPGIWAKPIIDILAVVPSADRLAPARDLLEKNSWICMSKSDRRVSLNKGYTPTGFAERVFHLHLRLPGDQDELFFRDLLRGRPDIASEYEALKLRLWRHYEHDRDGYTDAKSEFVMRYTRYARETAVGDVR